MNSVIESLKVDRIRVTHMGGRLFVKYGETWIHSYRNGEYTIHVAPLPGFSVPYPKDFTEGYSIEPIEHNGKRMLKKNWL